MRKILLLVILFLLSGCSLNNTQKEKTEVESVVDLIERVSNNADIENQKAYDYLNQQEEIIRNNFKKKIKTIYSDQPVAVEIIKSGVYTQGNYKFFFSTMTDKNGFSADFVQIYKKNKEIKVYTELYFPVLKRINYTGTDYYKLSGYTGGNHCCFVDNPFVIKEGAAIFGASTTFGNTSGEEIDNFFVKDNKLYIYAPDERFSYFYTSFAGSSIMWFPRFFIFDKKTANYIDENNNFKPFYLEVSNDIDRIIKKVTSKSGIELSSDRWLPWLTARAVYQLLGGVEEEMVKKTFQIEYLHAKYIYSINGDDYKNDSEVIWNKIMNTLYKNSGN